MVVYPTEVEPVLVGLVDYPRMLLFIHIYICRFRFVMWRKPEYPQKTTDLSQVTDKLYHIMVEFIAIKLVSVRVYSLANQF